MLIDVEKKVYSFDEIITLAFKNPANQKYITYKVSYLTEHDGKPEKSIIQGDTLKMQGWMRFNISATENS